MAAEARQTSVNASVVVGRSPAVGQGLRVVERFLLREVSLVKNAERDVGCVPHGTDVLDLRFMFGASGDRFVGQVGKDVRRPISDRNLEASNSSVESRFSSGRQSARRVGSLDSLPSSYSSALALRWSATMRVAASIAASVARAESSSAIPAQSQGHRPGRGSADRPLARQTTPETS